MTYPDHITKGWLREHPDCIFVFGDNMARFGHGGAAALRDLPNTYGFITQKYPDSRPESHYKPEEYTHILNTETEFLRERILCNPDLTFMITKLGGGLANMFNIRPAIIEKLKEFEDTAKYPNVVFIGGNT
jgi:hypothetical protein